MAPARTAAPPHTIERELNPTAQEVLDRTVVQAREVPDGTSDKTEPPMRVGFLTRLRQLVRDFFGSARSDAANEMHFTPRKGEREKSGGESKEAPGDIDREPFRLARPPDKTAEHTAVLLSGFPCP